MKIAYFSKKFKTLEYFNSHNTTKIISCNTLDYAKKVIKKTGITQDIRLR